MALYRKSGAGIIQSGGALAGSPDCCCRTRTDTCGGFGTDNCVGGVAPINITATVSLTDGGGSGCGTKCLDEGNGTHALTLTHPAVFESGGPNLEPTGCDPPTSYDIPAQCRWTWSTFHTFAPTPFVCDIARVTVNIHLIQFADGYRLWGGLSFDTGTFTRLDLYFRSAVIDTNPIDCVNDLDGVTLSFVCKQFNLACNVTGGSITVNVP